MLRRLIHFIKYNNAAILIIVLIFVAGSGVFAATETGQGFIGTQSSRIEGRDNTLLLEADLEVFEMDYQIERIEEDPPTHKASEGKPSREGYYYVYYTHLDLVETEDAWEYQLNEKVRKVSKKLRGDLGEYLAEEFGEEYEARIKELKEEQVKAESSGEETRTEITEYSGLIGQTLAVAEKVFPNYQAIKVKELPSPDITLSLPTSNVRSGDEELADSLSQVYDDYIERMDPDGDSFLGVLDNCPEIANPDQVDTDEDGIGDECDEYFTLKPVIEDEATTSDEVIEVPDTSTSTEENISTSSEETIATSSEEELIVEIVELEEVATSTN